MNDQLTPDQLVAAQNLAAALKSATEAGVLDELMKWIDKPDSINDVCNAVESLLHDNS